jgi:hypothetical protein
MKAIAYLSLEGFAGKAFGQLPHPIRNDYCLSGDSRRRNHFWPDGGDCGTGIARTQTQRGILDRLLVEYENRIHDLEFGAKTGDQVSRAHKTTDYEQLLSEALLAERRMILQLRNEQVISDEVLRRIQRDLDLAELRLTRTGQ